MYEQDIQLARLLLEKLDDMTGRAEALSAQLEEARGRLNESEKVREERSSYEDVLARAAELLDRQDLKRDSPETTELRERVSTLEQEFNGLDEALTKHRQLVEELGERAPNLIKAARAEIDGITPAAPPVEEPAVIEEAPEPEETAEPGFEEVPAEFDPEEEPGEAPAAEEPTTGEPGDGGKDLQQIFGLKELKVKETYTFGRGAAYVIDATSVLDRVPHYDLHFRAMSESEARDELISDIDELSRELSGDFFLVFNSWHQPQVDFSNKVEIRNVFGEDEGIKSAANDLIRELAGEMVAREKVVVVVTGDSDLSSSVSGQGVHIQPLSEFFIS